MSPSRSRRLCASALRSGPGQVGARVKRVMSPKRGCLPWKLLFGWRPKSHPFLGGQAPALGTSEDHRKFPRWCQAGRMEFFATYGRFWLPQLPQRLVHGSLAFDENGVRLELDDPLRAPVVGEGGIVSGSAESAAEAVVHGRLRDGREVTLLRLRGWSMPADGMQETWFADFAVTGGLTSGDGFSQMVVIFDYLMPWVRPPGIIRSELFSSSVTVDTQQVTLDETVLGDGRTVRLVSGVYGHQAGDGVHLDQWCGLEVTGEEPKPVLEVLNEWARPLQDLLVVCIGQPIRIEQVLLRTPEHDPRRAPLELLFKAVQPAAGAHPAAVHLDSYGSPALLSYAASPLPFSTLIGAWFGLYDRFSDVVTLLCGPYYAPFIYSRHRYASTFQSAEALARTVLDTREKGRPEHRARVEAVTAVLNDAQLGEDVTGWATRVLQGRNDKPLRQLMEELISSAGDMGRDLLATAPDLAGLLAAARTSVSHPGAEGPGALARYWLGEALIWVLRVRLLAELGVPVSDLSARVTQKPAFQDVLRELADLQPGAEEASPTTFLIRTEARNRRREHVGPGASAGTAHPPGARPGRRRRRAARSPRR
jgi:ApeA-like protein/HEPN superfamily Apea-like protein